MQPSPKAIEREFEALRDIRRRSSSQGGPGSLLLDPDLPAEHPSTAPPPLSPQAWAASASESHPKSSVGCAAGEIGAGPGDGVGGGARDHDLDGGANSVLDDPFHLFWVPAHLHPELAPSEFRQFLKEHAHTGAPTEGSAVAGLVRSSSTVSASGLGRKRSMLSRQYKPRDNDGVGEEEEKVVPLRRNSSLFREGPQLTISDLQKLEELADEASKSEDPTKLRRVLRRSMTLNIAPSFLDQMDAVPDTEDDADAPIIVPPPNQILKRTARTRIRKPNLQGDGGGHRFPASRRKSGGRSDSVDQVTSPTDGSSSGHGHGEFELPTQILPIPPVPPTSTTQPIPRPNRKRTLEAEDAQENRRLTYTEEASIFDAYATSAEDEKPASPPPLFVQPTTRRVVETPPPSAPESAPPSRPSISEPPREPQPQSTPQPVLYQPQPQRLLSPQQQAQVLHQQPSRSPSPETAQAASGQEIQRPDSRSSVKSEALSHHSVSSVTGDKRKDKDKKSLWRKVGGGGGSSDKGSKKGVKEKEKDKDKDKDKESGFFGSLFGGGKKKQDENSIPIGGGAGPATAAALLGASKSNNNNKAAYSPSISPQLGNPYARYPIHVERAIYRLSHIKLANPRRPLYEQVLISNLMFWYLGVINKNNQSPGSQNQNSQKEQAQSQNQNQTQTQNTTAGGGAQGTNTGAAGQDGAQVLSEKEQLEREREQREREERERAEKERAEKERMEQQQQRREPRRSSLTKPAQAGAATGGRRAEMPVKGPQYHIQSQVIEQEYSGGGGSGAPGAGPLTRTSSAPPPSMVQSQGYALGMNGGHSSRGQAPMQTKNSQQQQQQQHAPPQQQQMYAQPNGNPNYYYGRSASVDYSSSGMSSGSSNATTSGLPPGAMAPLPPTDPAWVATQVVGGSLPRNPPPASGQGQPSSHGYSQSADYVYGQQPQPHRTSRSPPGSASTNNINPSYDWMRNGESPGGGGGGGGGGKTPSRSLSASAVHPAPNQGGASGGQGGQYAQYAKYMQQVNSQPPPNGGLKKKMASASAVPPVHDRRQRASDDENVPLAMWQAQRGRK